MVNSKRKMMIGVVLAFAGMVLPGWVRGAPLRVGRKAPDFTLPDDSGHAVHLASFLGKKNVVLAFYVLAFTPG